MKGTPFVICALLGATQAIRDPEEYNYDDATQYNDSHMDAFMASTDKLQEKLLGEDKPAPKPVVVAPVAKPIEKPKPQPQPQPQADKKNEEQKKTTKPEDDYTQPTQALAESELTAENLGKREMDTEMANSMSDNEYLMIKNRQGRLAFLINNIQGPEDLGFIEQNDQSLLQLNAGKGGVGWHGRNITDANGDGIEDNEALTHDELDPFYDPLVYGVAEDIHNTKHGNLPGHKNLWWTESQTEPADHRQDIIQASWVTK